MTTKKNCMYIEYAIFMSVVAILGSLFVLSVDAWNFSSDTLKAVALFLGADAIILLLLLLDTHGGLFTDTVTINEEGIVFELKQGTKSYKWRELEKVDYFRRGCKFFVYPWYRPDRKLIQITCHKKFAEYFFEVCPSYIFTNDSHL